VAINTARVSTKVQITFIVLTVVTCGCYSLNVFAESTCFGTTSNGRLEGACKLPMSGDNFGSYSAALSMLGRTYVHCKVANVITESYKALASSHQDTVYVYGETGKKKGGKFKPHKTHQNGLSVDFMTPVVNKDGKSVPLPTNALNKYGYDIDFNSDSKFKNYRIDYEAIAAHLAAIKAAAANEGIGIWRVIFDPALQPNLKKASSWKQIADLQFSKRQSWVRHDDHYHIDFVIPCQKI